MPHHLRTCGLVHDNERAEQRAQQRQCRCDLVARGADDSSLARSSGTRACGFTLPLCRCRRTGWVR